MTTEPHPPIEPIFPPITTPVPDSVYSPQVMWLRPVEDDEKPLPPKGPFGFTG